MAHKTRQKDSTHPQLKIAMRHALIERLSGMHEVLDCYGGMGIMYDACYRPYDGTVMELDPLRIESLARARPTWRVFEGDSPRMLAAGVTRGRCISLIDCDSYGSPWPALEGFFTGHDLFPFCLAIAMTCGDIQKIDLTGGWDIKGWQPYVQRYGNKLKPIFLAVCQERLANLVTSRGYRIAWWHGAYGHRRHAAYCAAVLHLTPEIVAP